MIELAGVGEAKIKYFVNALRGSFQCNISSKCPDENREDTDGAHPRI